MKRILTKAISMLALLLVCLSMTGCSLLLFDKGDKSELPNSNRTGYVSIFDQKNGDRTLYNDYADVAPQVMRSVVTIITETASGSGVIIKIDGEYYILTCHHVISNMGELFVHIPDENARNLYDSDYNDQYILSGVISANRNNSNEISLVGGDKDSDIAVLKINAKNKNLDLVNAPIPAEGYSVRYAEKIFAIGNPSGELPMTFMGGNVSYLDREVEIESVGQMKLLQHNVSINHGSSGGGLFNMYGELIGITNAGSDEFYNLNYAIPFYGESGFVNIVTQLINSYKSLNNNFGYITGRWVLGVTITMTEIPVQGSYVSVMSVAKGSNCDGKILVNDRILSVSYYDEDGEKVSFSATTNSAFAKAVHELKKHLKSDVNNPPKIIISVYRPSQGQKEIEVELKEQYIFCDTGFYN